MEGRCLCKAVAVITAEQSEIGACHCGTCRAWTGGAPRFSMSCGSDVQFIGQEHISRFKSSALAERGFCKHCGTHIYYHFLPQNNYIISAGLFADSEYFNLTIQVFIDKKPRYYTLSNQTPTLTEQQIIERYSKL